MRFNKPLVALLSTAARAPQRLPSLPMINTKYKLRVVEQAQCALVEYLHYTRSMPFAYAELIATNSIASLCAIVRRVPFSAPTFSRTFTKLLRYKPINEFEFFLESIGIDYDSVPEFLPPKKFFLSEENNFLGSAGALHVYGFPWNRLGVLYRAEPAIFGMGADELDDRLQGFKDRYGFGNLAIVGVCLAFPRLLSPVSGTIIESIFLDLKRVFVEFGMGQCVEGNVDAWYELCCKFRVFYDLGCERGTVGELMCEGKDVFLQCPIEVLVRKAEYFCAFGVGNSEVGVVLLRRLEILGLDWETPAVSVLKLLRHFGMDEEELQRVAGKYPFAIGKNDMANLPYVTRAMDLSKWFIDRVKASEPEQLASCTTSCGDEDVDEDVAEAWKRLESMHCSAYSKRKVECMKRIGFGENALTFKIVVDLRGNGEELQERFNILLRAGMEYSKLCRIISTAPQIMSQGCDFLEAKMNFVQAKMGCSLDCIATFPTILCFTLTRIEFRYRFHVWLKESGLSKKDYSIASMVATSEKNFVRRLFVINPAIPKQYLECFSYRRFSDDGT